MYRQRTTEEKLREWAKIFAAFSLGGFGLGLALLLVVLVSAIVKTAGAFAAFLVSMFLTGIGTVFFWWVAENSERIVHRFKKLGGNK